MKCVKEKRNCTKKELIRINTNLWVQAPSTVRTKLKLKINKK